MPMKRFFALLFITVALVIAIASCQPNSSNNSSGDIVIGAKNFTEQDVLAELLAQQIEAKTGLKAIRKRLGDTLVCHQAMLAGQLDAYVEYTGTAYSVVLKKPFIQDAKAVYQQVKRSYADQFNLEVMPSLGFENTFAMIIRGKDARELNIQTLSEAAKYIPQWQSGFGYEFTEREEYRSLVKTYGLEFTKSPRLMDLGLLYRALQQGLVDFVAGNSTDGQITRSDFVILQDDKTAFPPYEAAPIVRAATLKKYPEVREAIAQLGGIITADEMQRLNDLVEGELRDVQDVVREFLQAKGLVSG
jgi:osmoprotectant transport system substrate-binding protein